MRTLNDVLDKDMLCGYPRYSDSRASECTGTIPAGQRHFRWDGVSLGKPGLDFGHPDNVVRFCIHCVRQSNWEYYYKDKPVFVKVEVTCSDGTRRVLEGEDADEWAHLVGAQAVLAWIHGGDDGRKLKWKTENPDKPLAGEK